MRKRIARACGDTAGGSGAVAAGDSKDKQQVAEIRNVTQEVSKQGEKEQVEGGSSQQGGM